MPFRADPLFPLLKRSKSAYLTRIIWNEAGPAVSNPPILVILNSSKKNKINKKGAGGTTGTSVPTLRRLNQLENWLLTLSADLAAISCRGSDSDLEFPLPSGSGYSWLHKRSASNQSVRRLVLSNFSCDTSTSVAQNNNKTLSNASAAPLAEKILDWKLPRLITW